MNIPGRMIAVIQVCLVLAFNSPGISYSSAPIPNDDDPIQYGVTLSSLSEDLKNRLTSFTYDQATRDIYNTIVYRLYSGSDIDPGERSDAYYYAAVYNHNPRINNIDSAIILYDKARSLRDSIDLRDEIYSRICGNLGLCYNSIGDNILNIRYTEEGLAVRQRLNGTESKSNVNLLINLTAAYLSASYFDQAIQTALEGIQILRGSASPSDIINNIIFHTNAGAGYLGLRNYSIAVDYLNVSYNLIEQNNHEDTDLLLSVLNALAVTNMSAGKIEKSIEYYETAISTIRERNYLNAQISITTFTNYGFLLGKHGDPERALDYIKEAVKMSLEAYGEESIEFQTQLENYAYFMADSKGEINESLKLYRGLEDFVTLNPWNHEFRNTVYYGFAQALQLNGSYPKALEKIAVVLRDTVTASDKSRMLSLLLKREVLYKMYLEDGSLENLKESFEAIRLAVDIYDRIRNDISTEESMLKAGSRYNYIYEECIFTLYQLYRATGDEKYSELSFNYSEKAKSASLLASTRQSRAMRFHIPEDLSNMEMRLEKEIKVISELLYNEQSDRHPDSVLIARYEAMKLETTMKSDSLRQVFKRDYPRYNSLKSNTSVSGFREIRAAIGRKRNFIEYYAADTTLYIYLINNNAFEMYAIPYTPDLQQNIRDLREIIVNPAIESGSIKQYIAYTNLAYSIYKSLFSPVENSLISDKLIIAPDDLLSYLPFETFLTSEVNDSSLNYRKLPFLVNSYDIVYAYSGTLLAESSKGGRSFRNPSLTFAPDYSGTIYVDSVILARQNNGGVLENIPGAREEAILVNRILGGELFLDDESTESKFKERASGGRIIHLAMHTLLNDVDPMYSKMVFNLDDDGPNDGKLNTYEVYDVPLNSKMVVLSSCNTGSGFLQSGEGVMSLARGFFYSGSPSVVMSLWEVDDRSGSQIIKMFYENLRSGRSKSNALRKARVRYLKDADQMRSHPYFWCTLVIMGDDSPLFYSRLGTILISLFGALVTGWIVYHYRLRSS